MSQPTEKRRARIIAIRQLSQTGFEMQIERAGIVFKAGQLINLHGASPFSDRSYTICSGENDEHLTILFRHIPTGVLTPELIARRPGETIDISGPYGEFIVRDFSRPVIFFATGTGVAPCRAFLRSYPGLSITLFHGVRFAADLFYRDEFSAIAYRPCVSREQSALSYTHGHVTDLARLADFPANSHFYLCGANEMIYEMLEILTGRGVEKSCIFTEEYYYRFDDT